MPLRAHDFHATAEFSVREGERVGFVLSSHPSWEGMHEPIDPFATVEQTDEWWREWAGRSTYDGRWADEVERSLITLKALTFAPTGGIVAAATTSLPEFLGGVRNWDYRFCWLRDAALTLDALMTAGYVEEATSWRDWVVRAVAGDPEDIQIMYGLGGERRLDEYELPHLDGYEGSAPVRVGNAASGQLQLDVYGELIDAIYRAHELGMPPVAARADRRSARDPLARGALAGPRRRRLGGARRPQAVRPLEGDGVGRRRPGPQVRGGDGARAGGRQRSRSSRRRCTRRSAARATTRSATRSRSTTGRRSSTRRCS